MDAPPAAASAPAVRPAGAAPVNSFEKLPFKDWRPEHVEQWRDSLPKPYRKKFEEFFANLPPEADGSTLASYDLPALLLVFPKLGAFAPELYARLQELKKQAAHDAVPASAANPLPGSSVSMSDEKLNKALALLEEMKAEREKEKVEDVSFSRITEEKWAQLQAQTGVRVIYETEPVASGTAAAPPYYWDPIATEDKHEETFIDPTTGKVVWQGYRQWLRTHLEIPDSMQLVSTKKMQNLLQFSAGSLVVHGNTDLIMLPAFAARNPILWANNAVVLFELKKALPPGQPEPPTWEIQAFAEVLSASVVGVINPFVILTDLCQLWRIYWFSMVGDAMQLVRRDASFGEVRSVVKTYAMKYSDPKTFNAEHKRSGECLPELPSMKRARYPVKKSDVADIDDIEPEGTAPVLRALQQLQALARACKEYDVTSHECLSPEAQRMFI